jgi:hypothetical protein
VQTPSIHLLTQKHSPEVYASGDPFASKLNQSKPMIMLAITLAGTMTIATANATAVHASGPMRLVKNLKVTANATQRFKGKGTDAVILHWANTGNMPVGTVDSGLTTGAHAVRQTVFIPWDIDDYSALLDPTKYRNVQVEGDWAPASDYITAGSGGTCTFAGTIQATPICIEGYADNSRGGREGATTRYYDQYYLFSDGKPLANGENRYNLTERRWYNGILLETLNASGARADGIFTNVRIELDNGNKIELTQSLVRELDALNRQLTATQAVQTGVFNLTFALQGHLDHIITTNPGVDLSLVFDCTGLSGGEKIRLGECYQMAGPANIGGGLSTRDS